MCTVSGWESILLFGILFVLLLLILNGAMKGDKSGIQAWIACNDILDRIRTELVTEAMDTAKDAIERKLIGFNGSLVNLPDKPSDTEMHMFIVNRLVAERDRIMHSYKEHLEGAGAGIPSPEKVQQAERLRKFLLCVERISMLMHYSSVIEGWMNDVAMQVAAADAASVMRATSSGNPERLELLGYVLGSTVIKREGILAREERELLEALLRASGG